ncbi:MAG: hypothetical protein SGPRY_001293 [Prymnesium sp.]
MEELHAAEEEVRLIEEALREDSGRAVEERLLEAGRQHQARRDAIYQAGIRALTADATFAPKHNPRSHAILRSSGRRRGGKEGEDIAARLCAEDNEAKRRTTALREQKEAARREGEMSGVTFTPEINARSRSLAEQWEEKGPLLHRMNDWAIARDAALRAAQQEAEKQLASQLQPPQLSQGSLQLIARMGRHGRAEEGDTPSQTSDSQSLSGGRVASSAEEALRVPQITSRAASLCRSGEVGSRLHEYAAMYAGRKQLLRQTLLAEQRGMSSTSLKSTLSSSGPPTTLEEDLSRREERRAARLAAEEARFPHKPKIDPRSAVLAGKRRSASFSVRRHRPEAREATAADTLRSGVDAHALGEECTFAPRLDEASLWLQRGAPTGSERLAKLHALHAAAEARRQAVRDAKEGEELEGCTFAPVLARRRGEREGGGMAESGAVDVADRCCAWAMRRDAELRRERDQRVANEFEECTFQPKMCAGRSSVCNDGFRPFAIGVDEFVSRYRKAKEDRERAATPPACSWTGRTTVPVEFHFNTNERGAIRSLCRPVEYTPCASTLSQGRGPHCSELQVQP